ncbi:MAG: alpha/beta hydrolase [Candidatus Cyclobacteriaceae bacterium M3_2C_046]
MHEYQIFERGQKLSKASQALILLHGRGGTAENILSLSDHFAGDNWYVAAPQATNYTWYPYSFMAAADQNEPWLSSALSLLDRLIQAVGQKIPSRSIYLAGFSQGACLTAEFAARNPVLIGGAAIFTGGLIGEKPEYVNYDGKFQGTSIYLSNGDHDPHVPLSRSEETKKQLINMGAKVKLDILTGRPHTILPEEIENARNHVF